MHGASDAPRCHLLHLAEAEGRQPVDEAALQDKLLAAAVLARAPHVLQALEVRAGAGAAPEQGEAHVHVGAGPEGALARDVALLPEADVHLRALEDREVKGLAGADAAGEPGPLPVLLPALVHPAHVHGRKILLHIVEAHPEDRHGVVHVHVGPVHDPQLELHLEGPPRGVLPPIPLPSPWGILTPRVAYLDKPLDLAGCVRALLDIEDAISVRRLESHLQDLLLGLLTALLGAAHAHKVAGLLEGEQLGP
mmetsp:Transcript_33600/g.106659  ORF Transcript_33600/g.106659 Transcript_33600/m.106659 type:complete len:251 (+) Transcript_33600:1125-1877(+)